MNRTVLLAVYARQPLPANHRGTAGAEDDPPAQSHDTTPAQRQRRVSRAALRLLLALIGLPDETGAYRFPHRRLSLTHTEEASVAVGAFGPLPASLAGVGADLELARPADPRTARFFLTEHERAWLARVPSQRRETEHVRLWTVKEALFKSDPANERAVLAGFRTADPAALTGSATSPASPTARFGYVSGRIAGDDWLTMAACFDSTALDYTASDSPTSDSTALDYTASHSPAPHAAARSARTPTAIPSPRRPEEPTAMPEDVTFERVAQRVSTLLSVPLEKITPQTTLQDLAADSFRLVETVVDLQEEFDSIFTQAELKQVNTLGELVELLRAPR